MEQENIAGSGSEIPEKVKCRFKGPDGEYLEGFCRIAEQSLEFETEPPLSIPFGSITHHYTQGYPHLALIISYDDVSGKGRKLNLQMENAGYFDIELSSAMDAGAMSLPEEKRYADFGIRFAANLIDTVITIAVALILSFAIFSTITLELYQLITFFLGPVYAIAFWSVASWTPGKKICGLKIIQTNGKPIGFPRSLLRYLGYFVSSLILDIGFFMILWDKRKQGLHDKIAGTLVVRVK